MASVIFLGGCNFRCPYCHNKDLVLFPDKLEDIPLEYVRSRLKKYKRWIDRVVFTGGEPTIHKDLSKIIRVIRRDGFKIKLDTNGYFPKRVKELVDENLVDFVSMDLKGPIDRYEKWCGVSVDAKRILETVRILINSKIEHEFRITFVPSFHSDEDIYEVAHLLKGSKNFTVQEFRPVNTLDPNFMKLLAPSKEKMDEIRKRVKEILDS